MKSGKEFLESLHPVEQANWEAAFKLDCWNALDSKHRQYVLKRGYECLAHFIGSSFRWSGTPQGHDYWELLSQK
jgi:hypothetical protein